MSYTAIILAGGFSKRFGSDKGILKIANTPLINHVVKRVSSLVNEIIIVTNSKKKINLYSKEIIGVKVAFFLDIYDSIGPLGGALTGLKHSAGDYSLIVPFDTPFLSNRTVLPSNSMLSPALRVYVLSASAKGAMLKIKTLKTKMLISFFHMFINLE